MSVELFYFSATGNTLYVAKELKRRLSDSKLVPIVSLLHLDSIRTSAETVGIISPLHGMTLPVPVSIFLKKLDPTSSQYIFAVTTRGGTTTKGFAKMDRLLARKGKKLDACFILDMPSNDPKFRVYEIPSADDFAKLTKEMQPRLDCIEADIVKKRPGMQRDYGGTELPYSQPINYLLKRLVLFGMTMVAITGANNYFYTDEKCRGCGTCQKVCLSGKIQIIEQRPVWQRAIKCHFCYACINYCPGNAIQIKSKPYMKSFTQSNKRYPHPYATVDDIARQKAGWTD